LSHSGDPLSSSVIVVRDREQPSNHCDCLSGCDL